MNRVVPLITFITPTYNREDLLENAILSVINQRRDIVFEREMIIIDDGSTDNTKDITKKYIEMYPNSIKYFYQENCGIPGKARNIGLKNMSTNSTYTIFLDSDDELKNDVVYTCLKKIQELIMRGDEESILGFYFLCEDENHNIVGDKKILKGKKEININYESFLRGEINIEMGIWLKSEVFLAGPKLRFSEIVISEAVMWSQMWQYMNKMKMTMLLWDYVGRFYRLNHNSETRICKNISIKRFKNNAEGNEELLKIIGEDLQKFGYSKIYSDYLFRIGFNYILCGEKSKGLKYIKKSLKTSFSVVVFGMYLISKMSKKIALYIYKQYT